MRHGLTLLINHDLKIVYHSTARIQIMSEISHSTSDDIIEPLFHILPQTSWESAKLSGLYYPESLQHEGFIHLSKGTQIQRVANTYYRGQSNLILLEINPNHLNAVLQWEPPMPPNGIPHPEKTLYESPDQRFPHLYGPLNLEAVIAAHPLPLSGSDEFQWLGIGHSFVF